MSAKNIFDSIPASPFLGGKYAPDKHCIVKLDVGVLVEVPLTGGRPCLIAGVGDNARRQVAHQLARGQAAEGCAFAEYFVSLTRSMI